MASNNREGVVAGVKDAVSLKGGKTVDERAAFVKLRGELQRPLPISPWPPTLCCWAAG